MRTPWILAVAIALCAWGSAALAQLASPAPAAPRFDIQRFIIEGNTILPQAQAEAIVAPYAGRGKDFGDVQRALEALQDAYVDRGYSAVRVLVPEQDLVAGQVRLQVIEARIRNVRVEGNKFFDTANIRASVPSVKEGDVPNTRSIGESLLLANENPAKQVRMELAPVDGQSAQVDAVLKVDDSKPQRHSVFLDNTGDSQTGEYRAGYGFQHTNVGNRDQVFTAQFITSPTKIDDVLILGAGYRVPLYQWKGVFDVYAGYSDVNSGTVSNLFTVSGAGTIFGMRYTQVLPRLESYDHRLSLGWDYRDFHNDVALVDTTTGIVPDIVIKPLSLTYSGRWSKVGRDLSFFVAYSHNLPGGADGDTPAFEATRPGANPSYGITRLGLSYTHLFPLDLMFRGVVNGQYTSNALVPGEQFGMGGMDNVRGYKEREIATDIGHRVTLEGYSPDLGASLGSDWKARLLIFADWARGRDNFPERIVETQLSSVGLGIRMTQGKALSIRADVGVTNKAAGTRPEGKEKIHFSLGYNF